MERARGQAESGARRNDATGYTERMGQAPPFSQPAQQQRQWQQPQQQWQQQQQSPERTAQRPAMQRQMAGQPSSAAAGGAIPPTSSSRIPVMKTQQGGVPISRPSPAAQWPLGGSSLNAAVGTAEPYRPPAGRSQAPQRPPRPSVVPSILDSSKIQDPTPTVFAYHNFPPPPAPGNSAGLPVPAVAYEPDWNQQSTSSSPSRPSTISSVGSIPDFPVPVVVPAPSAMPVPPPVAAMPAPRRSVTLGPPPSARRGASSFYSTVSYVSPIPEESPRSRSHASLASSAAMPESWGGSASSMVASPYYPDNAAYYDNIPEEDGMGPFLHDDDDISSQSGAGSVDGDHDGDEKQLVRSASIGKRTKASLVSTVSSAALASSISTDAASKTDAGSSITAGGVLNAYQAAAAPDPANPTRRASVSPPSGDGRPDSDVAGLSRTYSRLSAIRRPPRLDIDAVRNAEARGSLTSLPDLIRRATRLAASLENGRRPASQVDNFSLSPGMYDKAMNESAEKHQSGLSDMLAAFPPPAHANRPSLRQSLRNQIGSWPIPMNGGRFGGQPPIRERPDEDGDSDPELKNGRKRQGRRCCGLPLWGFLLLMLIVLVIVAAAVVIPLEFFVIRKQKPNDSNALAQCKTQLTCANGGSITVSAQGTCSCICTNDFTGTDCSIAGDNGCTTATVKSASSDGKSVSDVTLGSAMPRLLEQAQQNYSIPLDGTEIVALFNAGNLSCAAENALVTFDGEMERQKSGASEVSIFEVVKGAAVADSVVVVTETVLATPVVRRDDGVLITAGGSTPGSSATPVVILPTSTTTTTTTVTPTGTSTSAGTSAGTSTGTGAASATSSAAGASATFTVTEEVLDFARVAVLFILQEQESLANAESAQSTLQRFFTMASAGKAKQGDGVTEAQARNITLSGGNSINLVDYQVSAGTTLGGVGVAA